MPSHKDPEKFLEQTGFSKDELGDGLARALSDFARLTPPAPSQTPAPQTQMSKEIQDVTVTFPKASRPPQQANGTGSVGGDGSFPLELTFEVDVSGVVEDVILYGYFV